MVGASVTKLVEFFGASESRVLKVISEYNKTRKITSNKYYRGRKYVLSDRNRRTFHRVAMKNKSTTAKGTT